MPVDFENDLLLITCASGKQAPHLLKHIIPKFKRLRLQAHSPASIQRLKSTYPTAQVVQADLANPLDVAKLVDGVTAIWHIGPSFNRHEYAIGQLMVDAAVAESQKPNSKFEHFVFSSVIQTQLRKLLNHDVKRYVEEYLMESGLKFTILQPSHFSVGFPIQAIAMQEKPVWPTLYGLVPYSFTILEDYGEAAAKVFVEREEHYYAQYQLVSTLPIPYGDVVKTASKVLGKEVEMRPLSLEEKVDIVMKKLYGDEGPYDPAARDGAERLMLYYSRRGIVGNPRVMRGLLGREPMNIEQWMRHTLASPA